MLFRYSGSHDQMALCSHVVRQPTIQKIVFFVPNLCQKPQEDTIHYLRQLPLEDNTQHSLQVVYPSLYNLMTADQPWHNQATNSQERLAMPSTIQSAAVFPVTSYTSIKYVEPVTVPGPIPTGTVPISKPTLWTSL